MNSNVYINYFQLTEYEEERRKLEVQVQEKTKESADKDEISKELEKEILVLRDKNDAYKRMLTEKSDAVGQLRHNISDCHKEIEFLREKLQSTDNTSYRPDEEKSSDKCVVTYNHIDICTVSEEDTRPQRENSDIRGSNEGMLKQSGKDSVPYSYNVYPTVRVRDGSPRRDNITGDGEEDKILLKEAEEITKPSTPTNKASGKDGLLTVYQSGSVERLSTRRSQSPARSPRSSPRYPRSPARSPRSSPRYPQSPARSPPRSPRFPQSPARSPPRSPIFPQNPARSPPRSPRFPQSPARSPPRSPRRPQSPPQNIAFPVTERPPSNSQTIVQDDAGMTTTQKSSIPAERQPLQSPLLIDTVERRSSAKGDCAIINGTQIGYNRTPSASSEVSDLASASDNAHAPDKPRKASEPDQKRSRRYAEFLQRQSLKNKDSASSAESKVTLEKPKTRTYSSFRQRFGF